MNLYFFSILATFIISLISLISIFTLLIKTEKLKTFLIYLVSFSAGALFGDVFFHLLPEVTEKGLSINTSITIIGGILLSFFTEKIICWRHCHLPIQKNHIHRFAYMNLFGDFIHNIIDGLTIGASFLTSKTVGIATSLAVIFHEIPQEIGDFGVLIHGGFKKFQALKLNFYTALSAFLGLFFSFFLYAKVEHINQILIPLAAGNFIYIAGSDLIPELHKETAFKKSFFQITFFVIGVLIMYLLTYIE